MNIGSIQINRRWQYEAQRSTRIKSPQIQNSLRRTFWIRRGFYRVQKLHDGYVVYVHAILQDNNKSLAVHLDSQNCRLEAQLAHFRLSLLTPKKEIFFENTSQQK